MKQFLTSSFLLMLGTMNLWSQNGLKADYFDGKDFNRYVTTNFVDNIDFYWNKTPPVEGINPHVCSIRFTGRLTPPETGEYTFSARVDDGIRVWVDDVRVINNWQLNDLAYSKGKIKLIADSIYTITIEYFNALIEAELQLLWELPNDDNNEKSWWDLWWVEDKRVVIPTQYFTPPPEKEIAELQEPIALPIVPSKPAPKPKPKRLSKRKPIKPKPAAIPQKEPVANTIQQYIPKSVEFNRKESEILAISYPALDKLADFLVNHPNHKVRIEGHTDNVGDQHKNFLLSERRAYAVAAYLVKKGVDSKQLTAKGYGGTKPLVQSKQKQYHPENRRVAFIIE